MINDKSELYGRQIASDRVSAKLRRDPEVWSRPAVQVKGRRIICQRCGSQLDPRTSALPHHQFYCSVCLNLGRMSTLTPLCGIREPNRFPKRLHPMTWQGRLTSAQARCSKQVITSFKRHTSRLLWAVTGAGKTEMMFPGIDWALKRGLRVAWASPRVDVCLEIYPRLQAAFAKVPIALLHGRTKTPYRYTQLTVCTTHQLLRFYHAFDVLIIDEVDAFPFVHDRALHYAVDHAVKPQSSRIFLTATPTRNLLHRVHRGLVKISYLPLRFHRHLLPQIKNHLAPKWQFKIWKGKLPGLMLRMIKRNLNKHRPFLIFVPHIRDLKPVSRILAHRFGRPERWRTVYSQDSQRLHKVQLMRKHRVNFLITTTILERGVTFPGIDVIILGADEEVFSTSSLVQIAGRVGRKRDRPTGNVDFFIGSYTYRICAAVKQIRHMNYLGAKLL